MFLKGQFKFLDSVTSAGGFGPTDVFRAINISRPKYKADSGRNYAMT